ncbi:spindle pole body assembly component MPS3 [Kluyveromyces marxianus]|uniref:Spindle pole body assembly component MPS3 n=1 Tax=Kluyveromyces marxianus TaxID=4911 RepID=A0ABX6EUR9_KLUMA|nr:spindle pole body assembly component MPS3 [Kluyveromyces marxianus]
MVIDSITKTETLGEEQGSRMDRSRLYNKSIREAYENMVRESGSGISTSSDSVPRRGFVSGYHDSRDSRDSQKMSSPEGLSHNAGQVADFENSEFSDNEAVEDEQDGRDSESDYLQFKKSLIQDDEWLDDESDTDYTEEADRSFLLDNNDDELYSDGYEEDSGSGSFARNRSRSRYGYLGDSDVSELRSNWISSKFWVLLSVIISLWFVGSWISSNASSPLTPDLNKRINMLQNQLNQLNHERDLQKKKYQSDLDQNVKLIIQQFEKNIKRILPKNIKDFSKIYSSMENLESKVDTLNEKIAWNNVNETLSRLNDVLPTEIPVIIDSDRVGENGNITEKQVLLIPELHNYLAELIPALINSSIDVQSILTTSTFKYDLNNYVKEILSNEFQFIERTQFIQEMQSYMQVIKEELSKELESKTSHLQSPQQISTLVLKKMVHRIYNSNQHQMESSLNKATFSQGAKILNHLCSKTVKGSTTPVDLLQDCSFGCSTSTYWHCDSKNCQWAIRFDEPLFLTKISYLHGRFSHNLEVMSAAPKVISIYVKPLTPSKDLQKMPKWMRDSSYVKLGSLHYDLYSKLIKQDFLLPDWFIKSKTLVRSMIFVAEENHGNKDYTAMRKFIVNGVTPKDLQLMNSFPADWAHMTPEYSVSVEEQERARLSEVATWQDQQVPSFGEDEIVD